MALFSQNAHATDLSYYLKPIDADHSNTRTWYRWDDSAGNKKAIYSKMLVDQFGELYLRNYSPDGSYTDRLLEGENTAWVNSESGGTPGVVPGQKNFIFRNNPENGSTYHLEITDSPSWPEGMSYVLGAPTFRPSIDPARHLISLKTESGDIFPAFYYAPFPNSLSTKLNVALIFGGDGSNHLSYPDDPNWFIDMPTINHLRERGYYVLLPNFRGRTGFGKNFRIQGMNHMHDLAIEDTLNALDTFHKIVRFDPKNIVVLGHSRGGHFAALLATRLGAYTNKYKISKTVVSSGVFDLVNGYYNFYQSVKTAYGDEKLDFVADHCLMGPLNFRPDGKFSDTQWENLQALETKHYTEHYAYTYSSEYIPNSLGVNKSYYNMSPIKYASTLEGTMLALADSDELRSLSPLGAYSFQKAAALNQVKIVLHHFGHGWTLEQKDAMIFWFKTIDDFLGLNGD
jgi:acetyl esterase/lipase